MSRPVKNTGANTAGMTYDLLLPDGRGLTANVRASSSRMGDAPLYYHREADADGRRLHDNDAEAQLFDLVAHLVRSNCGGGTDRYLAVARATTGSVRLVTDIGPCHSCRSVIRQFKREFGNVEVTVRYPKRDARNIQPALGNNEYGYRAAVAHKGFWQVLL
jgi:The  BURPS668_1122 family of deaminases